MELLSMGSGHARMTDERRMIQESAREFAMREVLPVANKLDPIQGDNSLFTTLTLHYNPLYTNAEYARAHGHPDVVVCPLLVFNTVFGLSVEDLSEGGGPFLGVERLTYHAPVYPGDTLTARSTVTESRTTEKFPGFGITTWHTEGFNQHGVRVVDYHRTNLVKKRAE